MQFNFYVKIFVEKNENKQKEAAIGPFLNPFSVIWVLQLFNLSLKLNQCATYLPICLGTYLSA